MTEQTGSEVTVRPSPTVGAEVNGPNLVPMWLTGVPILVPQDRVAEMEGRGALRYGPEDLKQLPDELDLIVDEVKTSYRRFVDGVLADGQVDPQEGHEAHAMQVALRKLTSRMQDLVNVAYTNFPVAQGAETDDQRLERLAVDAKYHGWGERELANRYGLSLEEAQVIIDRPVDYQVPEGEPHAKVAGEWMPLASVPEVDREKIEAVTTGIPPELQEPQARAPRPEEG